MAEQTEWLETARAALLRRINEAIDDYDNAKLSLADAQLLIRSMVTTALNEAFHHGVEAGIESAELDGDYEDEEYIEFDTDEGDEDDA